MHAITITLFDWPASPFSLKVRSVLEYKRIAYRRVPILSPSNWLSVRRRGKVGKAPALEIDGRLYVDSTDICYELERRFADPPVIPADARQRALCHAIEEWADESIYFVNLYFQWHDPAGRRMVPRAFGEGVSAWLAYWFYLRRILSQIEGQGTSRKGPDHIHSDLQRHLDAVEALLDGQEFLLGRKPFLCDFAILGQMIYLSRTPAGSVALAQRTGIDGFLDRMKKLRGSD